MSQSSNTVYKTFIAGEDLSESRYCFVKLGSNPGEVVLATDANDPIIGVVADFYKGTSGMPVTIAIGGTYKVKASAAINAGSWVTATTAGAAVSTTTDKAVVRALALEAASDAGDIIEAMLVGPFTLSASA